MARYVLTQTLPRAAALARELADAGHEATVLAFERLVADGPGARALRELDLAGFDVLVFTSPSAAVFAARARAAGDWSGPRLAAVGPGTERALVQAGLARADARVALPPGPEFDADRLLDTLVTMTPPLRRVLVLRGRRGRTDWIERLRAAGCQVEEVVLYRDRSASPADTASASVQDWARMGVDATFRVASLRVADRLEAWLLATGIVRWAHRQAVEVPHRRIAEALARSGWLDVRVCVHRPPHGRDTIESG